MKKQLMTPTDIVMIPRTINVLLHPRAAMTQMFMFEAEPAREVAMLR